MKTKLLFALVLIFCLKAKAQSGAPVQWAYGVTRINKHEAIISISATLKPGWHIYAQNMENGGPIRTQFHFKTTKGFTLLGSTVEPAPETRYDQNFHMQIAYFENSVTFRQKIKLNVQTVIVEGTIAYQAESSELAVPSVDYKFRIPVN